TLNIRVTESGGTTHTEEFTFEVTDVNEGQITQGESFTINEDGFVIGNLLANDIDIDGDRLRIESYDQPENGTVTVAPDGNFVFQPNENFSGEDSFTYTMTDGNGESSIQTVELNVQAVADAANLEVENAGGNEDAPIDLNISTSLVDADGSEDISQLRILGVPENAQLTAGVDNGDGSWTLEPSDLAGLQIELSGLGNEDFDLQVEVTTIDGDSTEVRSETIEVSLQKDTLETLLSGAAGQVEGTVVDQSGSEFAFADSGVETGQTFSDDNFDFDAAFNQISDLSQDAADFNSPEVWNQAGFGDLDNDQDATSSSDQSAATANEQELTSLELNTLETLERGDLSIGELVEFDQQDLNDLPIELDGLDDLDGEIDTAGLTTASLLMMFTTREDSRKKLKEIEKRQNEDNDSE
ncbi:MAG: cadherin-like domain-containing protein, partial [Planctomycetota bacterium]